MRLTFALCGFLFVCAVSAFPSGDGDQAGGDANAVHEIGPLQTIRKASANLAPAGQQRAGSGDTPAAIRCSATCIQRMKEQVQAQVPELEDPSSGGILGASDAEKLNKYCTIIDTAKTCINACPNGPMKTMALKAVGIGTYICHDSTLRQTLPCISEAHKLTNATCSALNKCGQYKQKIDQAQVNRPSNVEELKELVKATCQWFKCDLDCSKEKVVSKCGQAAHNDIKGFHVKLVELLKFMFEQIGLEAAYPSSECGRVGA